MGEVVKKTFDNENTLTPAMETRTTSQSIRDILTLMKASKSFSFSKKNQSERLFGMVYSLNQLEKKRVDVEIEAYDKTPSI